MEEKNESSSSGSDLAKENSLTTKDIRIEEESQSEENVEMESNRDSFESVANAIDEAFSYKEKMTIYSFPGPRQWIGPRLFYVWIFPILAIKRLKNFLYSFYLYLCK